MEVPGLEFTDLLDPDFQRVVLALAVHDRDFYARARSILKPEYFTTAGHRAICMALHAFWDDRRDVPQELDLANRVASLSDNDIDKELWRDTIRDIYHNDEYEINRAEIELHLTTFAMRAESAVAVGQAAANIQRFDIQKLRTRMEEIIRIPNLFGVLGTDVRLDWHRATLPDPRRIFHTGFTEFDTYMRGGMREGDLVFFLGPMKRGKSMILINMGAGLMGRGHNVVHYSLEMYELDVLKRYIACLSGVPTNELQQPQHLLTVEACMEEIARYTQAKIIVREWPGGRMTDIDLDSHLSNVEAEYGDVFVPVCDYMALMRPSERTGDSWIDIPAQAVACRNLAKAHHVPFVSAHQTTTEGLRQSRVDERHLAGARALGTVVEYAWSIDQDEIDYTANRFCMRPFLSRHDRKDLTTYWRQEYEFAHIKALSETQFLALAPMQTQDDPTLPAPRRAGGKA